MYYLSPRGRVILFWLGDFSGRRVEDDHVAEIIRTNMRPSQMELVLGTGIIKTKDIIKQEKE